MNIDEARTKHLTDLIALEHNVHEALSRQRSDDEVRLNAHVNELVIRMERCSQDHYDALKAIAVGYGIEESAWKKAVGSVLGAAAGLLERVRDRKLSGVVRDNYVILSVCAMQYTSAHAFATAIKDDRLAVQTLEHLVNITPLLVSLSKLLPEVVVDEIARESPAIDVTAGRLATENTQRAWSRNVTESL